MEIDVSPGKVAGTFFHGALQVLVQKEASRINTLKYVGKLVAADKTLVSPIEPYCLSSIYLLEGRLPCIMSMIDVSMSKADDKYIKYLVGLSKERPILGDHAKAHIR